MFFFFTYLGFRPVAAAAVVIVVADVDVAVPKFNHSELDGRRCFYDPPP
jgi:hypothetical protein